MNQQFTELNIQKIYVKDLSFEVPNAPEIFQGEWKPAINLEIHVENRQLSQDIYEIVLKITVTNKAEDKTIFLAEVQQAGIFHIKGVSEEQLKSIIAIVCPDILFPYAREAISDLTGRGGFPPLFLAPMNFDALYKQHQNSETTKN